jgi:hypothetical protein
MNDPQFTPFTPYDAPPVEAQRKKHGCFFYGCITVIVLAVLLALVLYLGYRFINSKFNEYTADTPEVFPQVNLPADERDALEKRFKEFRDALEAQTPVEPLVLNSNQINALIEDNSDMKGKLHVDIKGDKIEGQLSWPMFGRFLNGTADLKVSLKDGVLIVIADSVSVKEQPLPESVMQGFRSKNLAQDAYKNPKNAEELRKIESIEIKDGTIIIKARSKPASGDEAKKVEGASPPNTTPELPQTKDVGKAENPAATSPP